MTDDNGHREDSPQPKHKPNAPAGELAEAHRPEAIRERVQAGKSHSYLRDLVFGAVDGTVTTFAIVSGAAGAGLGAGAGFVLGISNLLADGFSMAVGNYLSTKSEVEQVESARRMEHEHIRNVPEGEREEIRQIFSQKGFAPKTVEAIVDTIAANEALWVDTMVQEEHGLPLSVPSPTKAGAYTFLAFGVAGFIPLIPYTFSVSAFGLPTTQAFTISAAVAVVVFFGIGLMKARVIGSPWMRSTVETVLMGSAASAVAFLVGWILRGLVA